MDTTQDLGYSSANEDHICLWSNLTAPSVWPDIEQLLLDDRSWEEYYTLEAFKEMIEWPNVFTWTVHDDGGMLAVAIVQLEQFPNLRTIRFHWMAARKGTGLKIIRKYLEFIELWGRRFGAQRVEILGKPAWASLLADYDLHSVLMTKDLDQITEH